ncbi:cation:proton antiporter [Synoicihabitans lomoniglobus]|uniref:Cation:proton antiporter n=1 Tax=Synoicihabitans lomoniglobus TaxID=2909285 RepID=A0AAE9ZTD5_9BACT|nr:cation:proton antiporter [Opitutaceae bacterium LMO-M01]WED64815.1 cation:proton antiporter [Opitutaceae bacterium LMO-M01]
MEESHLLHDLGWLMATAAFVSILFRWLKQPAIIGYLAAGLLLGPYVLPHTPIHDSVNLSSLSELGVLFLMFYIGLEFDLGKLRPVAGASILGLVLQTMLMGLIGTTVGQWLGWNPVEGLFLGGILAISSSMVCFNLIGERGDMSRPYAQITAGVLILEDILAIVLLVVLAGVAVSGQLDFTAVGQTTFFVGIFVVAVFMVGKLMAPLAVKLLNKVGNTETLTLFVVGMIFAVSLLAESAHFSLALGSFLAGAIFSRCAISHEIEQITNPLKDFFSALFFVTIGTLIEPAAIWEHFGTILLVTALMVVGKFGACWLGFVLAAVPPAVAVRSSLAKVQIGEFGFVIASLGLSLGVTNPALKAVTTGVAVLSIMFTPTAVNQGERIIALAQRLTPGRVHSAFKIYLDWIEAVRLTLRESSLLRFVKRPLLRVGLDFLLLNALLIVVSFAAQFLGDSAWPPRLLWGAAALAAIPFLVDILRSLDAVTMALSEIALSRPALSFLANGPARELLRLGSFALILFGFITLFLIACAPYFPTGTSLGVFALTIAVLLVLGWRWAVKLQSQLEVAVMSSMADAARSGAREAVQDAIKTMTTQNPWPVELSEVTVPAKSEVVGRTLRQLNLRRETGATVVAVQRSGVTHYDVPPDLPLSPDDTLFLVAERDQLASAARLLRRRRAGEEDAAEAVPHQFSRVMVTAASALCGLTLREAGIRGTYGVTIIGVQRGDDRMTGPSPDECMHDGDLLLVIGPEEGISSLREVLV